MRTVLEGLMFFPRGGSAQVIRSLARQLPAQGWAPEIVCGSLAGGHGDARAFFAGLDVAATVDFAPDVDDPPFHPSYEDRPGAPDLVFARVDDTAYERHVATWSAALTRAGARAADVLHLHHLTPLHEAAARVAPEVPVLGHLHGTELLMLEAIADGPPEGWEHAEAWAGRMRGWAERCARIVLLAEAQRARIEPLLGVPEERCVVLPNGFDPELFRPREIDRDAFWREQLGAHAPAAGRPVFLYVGRFTAVKRLPLLIRAMAGLPATLVIVGGHPGEWEGEHPQDVIDETRADNVVLAGWHEHAELPGFLAASDVVVLPSVREQFGQVLVEGMACGRPAIAVDAHGPAAIVEAGETGWLVPPDDQDALRAALAEAIADPAERARRGAAAREDALARFAWPSLAERLAGWLDGLV